ITFLSSVPSLWRIALRLTRSPAGGSLRRIHCGSEPLSAHLWNRIRDWAGADVDVFNAYGITETGSWVAGTTIGEFVPEDGLVGVPWGASIRIRATGHPDEMSRPPMIRAPEEPGMVWLDTPALMQGYYRKPDMTSSV